MYLLYCFPESKTVQLSEILNGNVRLANPGFSRITFFPRRGIWICYPFRNGVGIQSERKKSVTESITLKKVCNQVTDGLEFKRGQYGLFPQSVSIML